MTGGRAGQPPRTDRSARAAGVAAVALLVLAVLLYGPWPIPIDRILPVSLPRHVWVLLAIILSLAPPRPSPPPRHFWFLLAIILSVGALACLSIWEQGMPRHARPAYQRSSRAAPWGRTETLFEAVAGAARGRSPSGPSSSGSPWRPRPSSRSRDPPGSRSPKGQVAPGRARGRSCGLAPRSSDTSGSAPGPLRRT